MAWIKIEVDAPLHPKIQSLSSSAVVLWLGGLCYSQRFLTDGVIPSHALGALTKFSQERARRLAKELVAAALWTANEIQNTYEIHDYLRHQQAREAVQNRHDSNVAFGKLGAKKRWPHSKAHRVGHRVSSDNSDSQAIAPTPTPVPDTEKTSSSLCAPAARTSKKKRRTGTDESDKPESHESDVQTFLRWFATEYKEKRAGADYLIVWGRDGATVKRLLATTTLDRLKVLAQIMLNEKCVDDFIIDSDRSIAVLSMRFNWLSDRLAAWEAKHARQQ